MRYNAQHGLDKHVFAGAPECHQLDKHVAFKKGNETLDSEPSLQIVGIHRITPPIGIEIHKLDLLMRLVQADALEHELPISDTFEAWTLVPSVSATEVQLDPGWQTIRKGLLQDEEKFLDLVVWQRQQIWKWHLHARGHVIGVSAKPFDLVGCLFLSHRGLALAIAHLLDHCRTCSQTTMQRSLMNRLIKFVHAFYTGNTFDLEVHRLDRAGLLQVYSYGTWWTKLHT